LSIALGAERRARREAESSSVVNVTVSGAAAEVVSLRARVAELESERLQLLKAASQLLAVIARGGGS
jgi:hypothetical protein